MPKIKFVKENKTIEVEPGTNLRKAALREGIPIYPGVDRMVNCMGLGTCTTCRVLIKKGQENVSPPGWWEKLHDWVPVPDAAFCGVPAHFFARIGHEGELRLACQTKVNGDIEVETQPGINWHGDKFWG